MYSFEANHVFAITKPFFFSFRSKAIDDKCSNLAKTSLNGANKGFIKILFAFLLSYYNRRGIDGTKADMGYETNESVNIFVHQSMFFYNHYYSNG